MSLPELKVSQTDFGGNTILTLEGHLNALTTAPLESAIDGVLATPVKRIVLDCSGLSFTSSAGLRVFLSTVRRMRSRGGDCAFAALTPTVREIFEMAGFLEAMRVYPSRQAALDSLES